MSVEHDQEPQEAAFQHTDKVAKLWLSAFEFSQAERNALNERWANALDWDACMAVAPVNALLSAALSVALESNNW